MDQPKRGPDRLARFYTAKSGQIRPELLAGRTTRSFMEEARTTSLRTLIERTVIAFVPPQLPVRHDTLAATHILCALQAAGGFTLGARVEASTDEPTAFIVGFCTNDRRGAWSALFGAVNFQSDSVATSRSRVGVFRTSGGSWWLGRNYQAVMATGVTFRMVSAKDPARTPMRALFGSWVGSFEGQLNTRHLLALTDDHPELSVQTLDVETTRSVDPEDATLRLRGSLIFE